MEVRVNERGKMLVEKMRKEDKEKKKKTIRELGIEVIDDSTAILSVDRLGRYELAVVHLGNHAKGKRMYRLLERKKGVKEYIGMLNAERTISINDLDTLEKKKIDKLVYEMYGDYRDQIDNIKDRLIGIEHNRLLGINECEGGDELSVEQLMLELKEWLLNNANDIRVVCVPINKKVEIGLAGGMKEVEKVFKMFDPDVDFKLFKAECKRMGLIKTDQENFRYTRKVEPGVREKYGLESSSFFNLNMDNDPEFKEKFLQRRNKCAGIEEYSVESPAGNVNNKPEKIRNKGTVVQRRNLKWRKRK